MKNIATSFDVREVMPLVETKVTVRLTGMAFLRARIWLGVRVIKLAGRIIGCKMTVSVEK